MVDSPTRTMRATRGRYETGAELGRGATATVWRARDTKTGREVALKRFHPHLVADPVARRRIEEEAAAASRVSHPNILSPIELIDDRDGLALVFPYVAGTTLAKRLANGPRITPREAASIALDIADALAVAHAQGVVHRDVKPGNVLLGADGKARLLDFGIAHAVDAGQMAHDMTGAGMAIGTLPYMAPEQLAAGPTTPASDVYSLGVMLYEILAGRRPYAATSPLTLAQEQMGPPAGIKRVPRPLVELVLAAMMFDANARPSAAQLARGLSAWREGRSDAAAPTSVVAAALSPRPVRPALGWLALGLAAVVLAVAVPIAASAWLTPRPGGLDLGRSTIDHPAVAAVQPPSATNPPPPVISASDPVPPDKPGGGDGHDKHHNKHKHHKHHKHHHGHH
ncbi:MAG: eukaryotic-like serine/threonine-protein kinase [Chloroflexota bacterium]|jgi:serine/threonine protein kinase|nr:eukaryotic-like serine/threonine-protein kinase [Chloroflexota bacterium]